MSSKKGNATPKRKRESNENTKVKGSKKKKVGSSSSDSSEEVPKSKIKFQSSSDSSEEVLKSKMKRVKSSEGKEKIKEKTPLSSPRKGRISITPRKEKKVFTLNRPIAHTVTVFACGDGSMGQLGLGPDDTEKKVITIIPNLQDVEICDFKTAYLQNAAILVKNDHTHVFTWGCNDDTAAHVLGRDGEESEPIVVSHLDDKNIVQISIGQYHMAALDSMGQLYFWGSYKSDEFMGPTFNKHEQDIIYYPALHPDLLKHKFKFVASAGNFTVAITSTGELLEWGWTRRGQTDRVSRKNTTRVGLIPYPVYISHTWKPQSVVCGHVHALVFVADAKGNRAVMSWGFNHHGQLGLNDREIRERPSKINGLPENVIQLACGEFHNLALTEDHKVYAWGRNSYNQLGITCTDDVLKPQHVVFFDSLPNNDYIVSVGCGSNHSLAVTNSGTVYTWGFAEQLQLGNGVIEDVCQNPLPIKSKNIPDTYSCMNAYGGSGHSIFAAKKKTKFK